MRSSGSSAERGTIGSIRKGIAWFALAAGIIIVVMITVRLIREGLSPLPVIVAMVGVGLITDSISWLVPHQYAPAITFLRTVRLLLAVLVLGACIALISTGL